MIFMGKSLGFPVKIIPSNQPNEAILSHRTFLFLSIFKCPAAEFQKGTGTASAPVPPAHDNLAMTKLVSASLKIITW